MWRRFPTIFPYFLHFPVKITGLPPGSSGLLFFEFEFKSQSENSKTGRPSGKPFLGFQDFRLKRNGKPWCPVTQKPHGMPELHRDAQLKEPPALDAGVPFGVVLKERGHPPPLPPLAWGPSAVAQLAGGRRRGLCPKPHGLNGLDLELLWKDPLRIL